MTTDSCHCVLPEPPSSLAQVWPEVRLRLLRLLRSRGVDSTTSEDIVQETATRVLERAVPYEDSDDLFRWAAVVGWRLAVDDHRRRTRFADDAPDGPAPIDVQREVEDRLRLADLGAQLATMSQTDREALRSVFDATVLDSRKEAIKHSVRLHRARNRLRQRLEEWGPLGIGGWLGRTLKLRRPARAGLALGAAASILGAMLLVMPHLAPTDRPTPPDRLSGSVAGSRLVAAPVDGPRPAPAGPSAESASTARGNARAARQSLLPSARVDMSLPGNTPVWLAERPKRPGDHLVCVHLLGGPDHCLDAPPLPYPQLP